MRRTNAGQLLSRKRQREFVRWKHDIQAVDMKIGIVAFRSR